MCPPSYHHNGFVATHGFGHMVYMMYIHHVPKCMSSHKAIAQGNTPNILHSRCMEQVESHPHFIFYCELSKVTLDYISELINLNYSFNLPFKLSLKTIKMGSFSILRWCAFKNSTHNFRSDIHASPQSLP